MTEAAALELRHVRLAEPVTLRPAPLGPTPDGAVEEGVFVALDDSPPVRTVLAVVEGGRRRALEVAWVVEVAGGDDHGGSPVRGFYGRWVADEALERAARVGTEHLEDGTPVVQPVVYDNSAVLDVSDTSMAMPAPVMMLDDDTGVIETNHDEDPADERNEAPTVGEDQLPYLADTADVAEPPSGSTGETVSYTEDQHPEDAVGSEAQAAVAPEGAAMDESGESSTELAETSTNLGEPTEPTETTETSPDSGSDSGDAGPDSGDAGLDSGDAAPDSGDAAAAAKGGRKKRGRKRR